MMKKTVLAAALLAVGVGSAEAGTAGLTGSYSGTGVFTMLNPFDSVAGSNSIGLSFDFDAGTVGITNTATFFGNVWTAKSFTVTDVGGGFYQGNGLFDWSTTSDIVVDAIWDITDNGNGTISVLTVDPDTSAPALGITDPDLGAATVRGWALSGGAKNAPSAFLGFNPNFDGTISAVPIPAAAWLFGSGILGLVGVSRRKKMT